MSLSSSLSHRHLCQMILNKSKSWKLHLSLQCHHSCPPLCLSPCYTPVLPHHLSPWNPSLSSLLNAVRPIVKICVIFPPQSSKSVDRTASKSVGLLYRVPNPPSLSKLWKFNPLSLHLPFTRWKDNFKSIWLWLKRSRRRHPQIWANAANL